jgi:hypothetical protein
MILENLIQEYFNIISKLDTNTNQIDLSKIDMVTFHAKREYLYYLKSYINDLIKKEASATILKQLINTYEFQFCVDNKLIISLYKKYLMLEPNDEQYYKKFSEIINLSKNESTLSNAQELYKLVEEHKWNNAIEIINSIK